jgi:abhydrolase domain-containing protein 6
LQADQIPVFTKIVNDSLGNRTILEDRLHLIHARTLIFWGKNDRILDVSSLPILEQKLVNAEQKYSVVFDECGHTVQHEKYEECADAINQFLNGETPRV